MSYFFYLHFSYFFFSSAEHTYTHCIANYITVGLDLVYNMRPLTPIVHTHTHYIANYITVELDLVYNMRPLTPTVHDDCQLRPLYRPV